MSTVLESHPNKAALELSFSIANAEPLIVDERFCPPFEKTGRFLATGYTSLEEYSRTGSELQTQIHKAHGGVVEYDSDGEECDWDAMRCVRCEAVFDDGNDLNQYDSSFPRCWNCRHE